MPKLSKMKFKSPQKYHWVCFMWAWVLLWSVVDRPYSVTFSVAYMPRDTVLQKILFTQKVLIADSVFVTGGSCCPPLLSGTPSGLNPNGSCACCYGLCEFIWASALLCVEHSFLGVFCPPPPGLTISCLLFHIASRALRREVWGRHHIQDRVLQSPTSCTFSMSLLVPTYCKSILWCGLRKSLMHGYSSMLWEVFYYCGHLVE